MAAAPSEARVPCAQCGGLVHPIAGRCRHCKADLSAIRGARAAATAPLPALDPLSATPRVPVRPGEAASQPAAPVVTIAKEASQPVLPPRPTAGYQVPPESSWKSWPMVVIVLATIAIVTAVVIMVWPASHVANAKRTLEPPPAPERMDTNSLTPTPIPPPPHASLTPPSRRTPDPLPPQDPDVMDPLGRGGAGMGGLGRMGGLGPLGGLANLNAGLMKAVLQHGCDRLTACGSTDDVLRMTCKVGLDALRVAPPPPTCDAAARCIKRIDELDCTTHMTGIADLLTLLPNAQDCLAALAC